MPPKLSISSALSLANSKHKIPQIGFGVYLSPQTTCVSSCTKALDAGYRHIDTAIYYENEAAVGRAIKESKIPRSEIFVTTKILSPGKDVESTYKIVEESVKKLGGEDGYVDLFLIHTPNGGKESRRLMWLALEKAKETGKARDIGVSNYGIGHIKEIKEIGKIWPPVVNQIEVSMRLLYPPPSRLIKCSYTPGVNSATRYNTARITTLSLKPIARSFATKKPTIRHSTPLRKNTASRRVRCSFGTASRKDGCHCLRVIRQSASLAMPMCMASSWTRRIWRSWMHLIRGKRVRLCRLLITRTSRRAVYPLE